jgi:ATP/maltotriose-dependent transcriptional regulator MalT
VALELDEVTSAGILLAAARRGLARHPDAGTLPHLLAAAERAHETAQGGGRRLLEPLTQAELRVLELAPTCLSIESIARTLSVSRNTIKTHLKAIYAKLSVASRSEAVDRARELRLINLSS